MEQLKKISGIDTAVAEITKATEEKLEKVKLELSPYVNGVVTEDTLTAWKADRATINKERSSFKSERTSMERNWKELLAPISEAYKKIDSEYGEAIDNIDFQLKEFEEKRIESKKEKIRELFESIQKPETVADWINLDEIWNPKWTNQTYKMLEIDKEIKQHFDALSMKRSTLKMLNNKFEKEGLEVLRRTKDVALAIQKMKELEAMEQAIKDRERQEEELIKIQEEKPVVEDVTEEILEEFEEEFAEGFEEIEGFDKSEKVVIQITIDRKKVDELLKTLEMMGVDEFKEVKNGFEI